MGFLIFVGVIIYKTYIIGDDIRSVDPTGKVEFEENLKPKRGINLNGEWKMVFDFKDCDSRIYDTIELKTIYSIIILHQGYDIEGSGYKVAEIKGGVQTNYSRKIPIRFTGRIKRGKLALDFFENNQNEVTGIIKIEDFGSNYFEIPGYYFGKGTNCDGPVLFTRKTE